MLSAPTDTLSVFTDTIAGNSQNIIPKAEQISVSSPFLFNRSKLKILLSCAEPSGTDMADTADKPFRSIGMKIGIYFTTGKPDEAIVRGLASAGCNVQVANSIADTREALDNVGARLRALRTLRKRRTYDPGTPLLVADIQSGAIALLDILQEQKIELPPTMLIDNLGNDIQVPLRALQHGVKDYLLPEDDPTMREHRARKLVEHTMALITKPRYAPSVVIRNGVTSSPRPSYLSSLSSIEKLRWDPVSLTIQISDDDYLRLSPMEGRTFDLLYNRRGKTVSIEELIETTLTEKDSSPDKNIQLLRTHLARLRRRLADHPHFGYRIENMRGSGYQLI
jgi:DNA-binding response OmpR family regulator